MAIRIAVLTLLAAWVTTVTLPAQAQFETRATFFMGQDASPYSLVAGDFNGDGIPDVAVAYHVLGAGSVQILLGNGNGTFRQGATYAVDFLFYGAAASLRNNGILDLVFGGVDDAVYVMLGDGDGTFQSSVSYPTAAASVMVALGDFTGHGKIDVADLEWTSTLGANCNCVQVLPGNGDGTFGAPVTTPVPYDVTGFAIAPGDFNDDGKLDLAVGGQFSSTGKVGVLLGNGDGTFTDDGYYLVGGQPFAIAAGYFTGDKTKSDLAVSIGGAIDVLLGNGDGTFQQAVSYSANWGTATWVVAQDFSGDGKIDLAASNFGDPGSPKFPPGVDFFRGNGDGTFMPSVFYPAGSDAGINYVAAGNFSGSGTPGLVLADLDSESVITLLNTGVVSFSPTTPLNFKKQAVGKTSAPQTVTLTNTGTTELKIQSIKASSEFAVKSTCGERVAAGASCTISATFSPTKQGAAQGTITIIDNASSKPQVIELLGTGT